MSGLAAHTRVDTVTGRVYMATETLQELSVRLADRPDPDAWMELTTVTVEQFPPEPALVRIRDIVLVQAVSEEAWRHTTEATAAHYARQVGPDLDPVEVEVQRQMLEAMERVHPRGFFARLFGKGSG